MSRVLACLDGSHVSESVAVTAATLADLLGADVDAVTVRPAGRPATGAPDPSAAPVRTVVGDTVEALRAELGADGVVAGVLGACRVPGMPLGHVARALLTTSSVPLVLVPAGARPLSGSDLRILVPLDGADATALAVLPVIRPLVDRLGEIVVLHVLSAADLPPFVSSAEDREVIAQEFLARQPAGLDGRVELRLGHPAATVLEVADDVDADAVVVAWSQRLEPGRAEVLRRLLHEVEVPVVVHPMVSGRTDRDSAEVVPT